MRRTVYNTRKRFKGKVPDLDKFLEEIEAFNQRVSGEKVQSENCYRYYRWEFCKLMFSAIVDEIQNIRRGR